MTRYALAEHVFVCLSGQHVVLLDLKQDRYLALEAAQANPLGLLVPGWPVGTDPQPDSTSADAVAIAKVLAGRGLLSEDESSGKDATPVTVTPAVAEIVADTWEPAPHIGFRSAAAFVSAHVFARAVLRFWPLERVVRRVRLRNAARLTESERPDVSRLRHLVEVFARLQPFFFVSKDACLFESFSLLEFLARHGLYGRWIFGVQAKPFAAHCWVQCHGVVLNDTVEHVNTYTPIMVV